MHDNLKIKLAFFSLKFQQRSSDFDNQSSLDPFELTNCFGHDTGCFSSGGNCYT